MKPYWTNTHIFINGAARFSDLIYISTQQKDLAAQDVQHSIFIAWYRNQWFQEEHKNWNCAGMCIAKKPAEKLIAISEDGDVWTYVSGNKTEEEISPRPSMIKGISSIEGTPYACGMNRQAYKRLDENNWFDISAPKPEKGKTRGFESISGYSEGEIYAVGWGGEIWLYNDGEWKQLDSPTNVILTCVTCSDDGNVYISGQQGVIIKGRGDKFELISDDDFVADIWDITYFNGKVYLSSMQSLYYLDRDSVELVDFGEDSPTTCNYLSQAEGVLWSIGLSDLFSFDGEVWKRIE